MIGDRHLHTSFSVDSDEAAENAVLTAIRLGMKELCVTDHRDFDFGPEWFLDTEEYVRVLSELKKQYADRIDLHIGVEVGLNPEYKEEIRSFLNAYPFEYIIGSVHSMGGDDPYYRDHFDMDDRAFFQMYFDTLLERAQDETDIDVFGHFDYVIRYAQFKDTYYDPADYAGIVDQILKILIQRKIALELNTAGLRKGLDFVHPHPYILQRYKDLGGRLVSVGSDAHAAADIGRDFDAAKRLMNRFGFTERDFKAFRTV